MYRIGQEELEALKRIIESKQLFRVGKKEDGHFQEVLKFEREWSKLTGARHTILMVGGGTSALACGLIGMNVGPGDEVIIPGYTFIASAAAVLMAGAIPVIAEIDDTLTIDPYDIEKKISDHTKAIMPVHMVGFPCDMNAVKKIAKRHKLRIIEDVCQSVGGSYEGKRLGSIGDAGAFSFNYFKIISCGEGGALITNDDLIHEKAQIYHDCGANFWPYKENQTITVSLGIQLRASEITGAIMRVQMKRLDGILMDLRRIKELFISELYNLKDIHFIRSNDIHGDCGIVIPFLFEDEKTARKFTEYPGIDGWLPIDTGRHIYSNWEPVLNKKAGPNELMNPYRLPQNKGLQSDYSIDMCPNTLNLLSRSVFISINPDWSEQEVEQKLDLCRKGLKRL